MRAYILCAVVAVCKSGYAPETARRRGVASIVLSVIGIVFGIIFIIIIVIVKVIEVQQHVRQWFSCVTKYYDINITERRQLA